MNRFFILKIVLQNNFFIYKYYNIFKLIPVFVKNLKIGNFGLRTIFNLVSKCKLDMKWLYEEDQNF